MNGPFEEWDTPPYPDLVEPITREQGAAYEREHRNYTRRAVWAEVRSSLTWAALRSPYCGWRYVWLCLWLALNVTWDGKTRCFGRHVVGTHCRQRVYWDPIVGAYCALCFDKLVSGRL